MDNLNNNINYNHHKTVLKTQAVDALFLNNDNNININNLNNEIEIYIDATFGRGGHSLYLLEKLEQRFLKTDIDYLVIAFDQDPAAEDYAKNCLDFKNHKFIFIHDNFTNLEMQIHKLINNLNNNKDYKISGILADLGVSSPQIDQAERGFSFMHDGPLDMRMNPETGKPASQYLNELTSEELTDIFQRYGEERLSKKIATLIKNNLPIENTLKLANLIKQHTPFSHKKHPATRVFQALRIFVNQEMQALDNFLQQSKNILSPAGVLSIITFHSLEDRLVKQTFKAWSEAERDLIFHQSENAAGQSFKKTKPTEAEIAENARSRSAILRAWQKY